MPANGGDVEYLLSANDEGLDADLENANKRVKKSAEKSSDDRIKIENQTTKGIKKESEKVVKNAEKAASDMAEEWRDAGNDSAKAIAKIGEEYVEIDVKANTGKAESQIKSVSKDKSIDVKVSGDVSDVESEIKGLESVADETGEKIGKSLSGNIGNVLKDSLSSAADSSIPLVGQIGNLTEGLSATQVAAVGAGAAIAGIGVLSVGAANEMDAAMNTFLATTGKSTEETERYQGILENIYANNYGESFDDIANAMSEIRNQIGPVVDGWDDSAIQNFTESAFALRDTFGYDISESVRAANTMMEQFCIDGDQAFDLIAKGAQNGLDYSGELIDSINEYSVQFAKLGLDANDMFQIFQNGADSGAWNLDKIGDAVKEFSIRVIDGSDTTKAGFEGIGLSADEMAAKFGEGGDAAREAFQQTVQALASVEDPLERDAAGVALFGTMWEDLGPDVVAELANIEDGAYATADSMNQIKDVKYDDLGSMFEALKRNVELLLIPIGEALIPLLQVLIESVLPLVTDLLGPLITEFANLISPIVSAVSLAIEPLISALIDLINLAIQPLLPVLKILLQAFSDSFQGIASTVVSVIGNITNILRNIIDFVKNVFTGNWRAAWQNVKTIFSNIVSGLGSIFKAPINSIIDGINSFTGSLSKIKVPDWVPGVGGKSINIAKIPRLKKGLDRVPHDYYPAFLDEDEMVLTREEANVWRSIGGIQGILGIGSYKQQPVNVNVHGGQEIDYDRLGEATASALTRAGITFKVGERNFARLVKEAEDYHV